MNARSGAALTFSILLATAVAGEQVVGLRQAFEMGSQLYVVTGDTEGHLSLMRWSPSGRRFESISIPGGAGVPAPGDPVRIGDRAVAFVGQERPATWSLSVLTFDAGGNPLGVVSGPAWQFDDRLVRLHPLGGGRFVVVGAMSAAIVDPQGLRCRWAFPRPAAGTVTSAVRKGSLITDPNSLRYDLRCPVPAPKRLLSMEIRGILAEGDGWLVTLAPANATGYELVAMDDSFRPKWMAKVPPNGWRLDRRPAGTVVWTPNLRLAFLVETGGTVWELQIPKRGEEWADLIDSPRGTSIAFLTEHGPVTAVRLRRVSRHRIFIVPSLKATFTWGQVAVIAALIVLLVVARVRYWREQR